MKFKYLNEADTEFDLYPVIKDLQKLNKEFQKEGEILWTNKSGQKFRTYHNGKLHQFEIEPYALRYFGRRWYVLARTDFHNSLRLYALDRMKDVKISDKLFKLPEDFSADDYFSRYFGVIVTDAKAENIQLKTTDTRAKYLRSLPLHHSQKEIAANLFELHLVPTDDFINAVRAMETEVEVVSPDWLRKRLLQDAKDLVKKYSKNKPYCFL